MQDNPILFNLDITFNQVVRGSSPRCLSNDMVCKDHQKKSSSTTFFCGVKLPLFTSSIDIILSLYVTQYAASKKLLGLLKIFVYSNYFCIFCIISQGHCTCQYTIFFITIFFTVPILHFYPIFFSLF